MYKCCRHRRLYSVRKIIVPIWSLSKGKIRETLYQILTYTRYIYLRMNTEANCQLYVFLSLSLKKKEFNDFTFALSCFEHSAFSLWSRYCMQADDTLQILPCACVHVWLHMYHEWSNSSYHLTFSLSILFRKKDKTRPSKEKNLSLCHSFRIYSFLLSFLLSRWASICQTYLIKWMT
jgi:hypothetical protein